MINELCDQLTFAFGANTWIEDRPFEVVNFQQAIQASRVNCLVVISIDPRIPADGKATQY